MLKLIGRGASVTEDLFGQVGLPLLINLLSSGINGLILWALRTGRGRKSRLRRPAPWLVHTVLAAVWLFGAYAAITFAVASGDVLIALAILLVPSAVTFGFQWYDASRFSRVGFRAAHQNAQEELEPRRTLKLVTNSLDFLGTGAAKLTREDEFTAAVLRCSATGAPVRLLLSNPGAENLRQAAQRADKPQSAYQQAVTSSLKVIAELRENRSARIEVRFYTGARRFRMMFINDEVCLLSYNVYATQSPLSYPAVRLHKAPDDELRSFYWAFKRYFEDEWESAEEWDYRSYIQ